MLYFILRNKFVFSYENTWQFLKEINIFISKYVLHIYFFSFPKWVLWNCSQVWNQSFCFILFLKLTFSTRKEMEKRLPLNSLGGGWVLHFRKLPWRGGYCIGSDSRAELQSFRPAELLFTLLWSHPQSVKHTSLVLRTHLQGQHLPPSLGQCMSHCGARLSGECCVYPHPFILNEKAFWSMHTAVYHHLSASNQRIWLPEK